MRARKGKASSLRSARRAAIVAMLAALAVVLVPVGSAKPPPQPSGTYQACLTAGTGSSACTTTAGGGDYSILSGTHLPLQVRITNDSTSNQTLDFVNLVPTGIGVTIDTAGSASATNYTTYASTSTSTTLQLRNLGLAPGQNRMVAFYVNSSATSCTDGTWATVAQSSSTPSAFVFTNPPSASSGLTSLVAVDCKLVFQNEPTPALPNATITSAAYTPTVTVGGSVHNVTVVAQALPVPLNGGSVTLAPTSGSFDDPANSTFTGTSGSFSSSNAAFAGLTATGTGGPFTLTASAGGFSDVASSPPFAITKNGTPCDSGKSCTLTGTDASGKTLTQIATSAGFAFVGASPSQVPLDSNGQPPTGCQTWSPTPGVTGFVEFDGRTDVGTMNITYYVSQGALKARYGKNTGQQFVPMCFGAKQVVNNQAVDCTPGSTGWTGDALDVNGAFTGRTSDSVCGPGGYYWGIISSYQDKLDQTKNPVVTGWGGPTNIGQNFRSFVISLPSGWDARGGM